MQRKLGRQLGRQLFWILICGLMALVLGDGIAYLAWSSLAIITNHNPGSAFIFFAAGPILSIAVFSFLCRGVLLFLREHQKLSYPVNVSLMVCFLTMLYIVPVFFGVVMTMTWWFRF